MTVSEIERKLDEYRPDQTKAFQQMASERGLNYNHLTPEQYKRLIEEEAAFCERIAAHPSLDDEESKMERQYAADLREIAASV